MPPLYRRHPKPAGIIILNHFLMLSPLLYDYSTIDLSHQLPSIYVLTARQRTVCIQLFDAYIQMFATSVASLHPTRCATTISPSYNACASAIPFILLKTLTSSGTPSTSPFAYDPAHPPHPYSGAQAHSTVPDSSPTTR